MHAWFYSSSLLLEIDSITMCEWMDRGRLQAKICQPRLQTIGEEMRVDAREVFKCVDVALFVRR